MRQLVVSKPWIPQEYSWGSGVPLVDKNQSPEYPKSIPGAVKFIAVDKTASSIKAFVRQQGMLLLL